MKKKNLFLLLLVLTLGLVAYYLSNRNESSTIREELMDFAVKDTASITKIFLADRNGNSATLVRKAGIGWRLNDSLPPRPDMLKNLLEVVHSVSVKSRVPKSGFNNVISSLASSATKCEVYLNNESKPARVYYVGGHTADALGTFMMIENSSVPFVMEIPGFNGYLTSWYNPVAAEWIEPLLFRYDPEQINKIAINYPAFPDRSFVLLKNDNKFSVFFPGEDKTSTNIDSVAIENYLSLYRQVFYEVRESRMSNFQKDSLRQTNPLTEIEIRAENGQQDRISIFPMPIHESSITLQDSLGNPLKYDVDRMYGYLHDKNEWVVIQHFSFDKFFRRGENFLLNKR